MQAPDLFICCWQNDLSFYLIVFSSALDHWIDVAEYNAFLFKVAIGFVYLITQLLVLLFRNFGEAVDKFTAQEGEVLGIGLRHSVREYNGRYYGEASIVDFEQVQPF